MCATSDGSSESVRRRSQPNQQAERQHQDDVRRLDSGRRRRRASSRSRRPRSPSGRPPSHRAGRETPAPRPAARGTASSSRLGASIPGSRHDLDHLLHALRLDAELADRDRQGERAERAEHERTSSRPAESPSAGKAAQPSGATATTTASKADGEEGAAAASASPGRAATSTTATRCTGTTTPERSAATTRGWVIILLDQWVSCPSASLLTPWPAGLIPRPLNRSCRFLSVPPVGELR